VCNKIRVEPFNIKNALCHYGMIKMIILEELRQRERTWQHFLFWEGFETQTQPINEKKKEERSSQLLRVAQGEGELSQSQ
jgi:hypothetical protein